jgi:O-antigen ligase
VLLPGQFNIDLAGGGAEAFDAQGRRLIQGPTQHGLEIATMLAMALPMTVVALLGSSSLRRRAVFAVAIAFIFAGCVSTYRKTGILAPVAGLAMMALLRPVQMVKLLPLGLIIVVIVHAVSPGALGSVVAQLKPERLDNQSVNQRKADYDAVHPDVFNHPAVGRGYGTYDPHKYRIIDNEYLLRLIETGFLGLAAYLGLMLSVAGTNLRTIRQGHPQRAAPALAAAGAAAAFLVASALFDVMSFPHAPYVFLYIAGLAAACATQREETHEASAAATRPIAGWLGAPRSARSA